MLQTQEALAEIEDLVIQLRGLGWKDSDIFSIKDQRGVSTDSTQILQESIKLMSTTKDINQIQRMTGSLTGVSHTTNRRTGLDTTLVTPPATPLGINQPATHQLIGLTPSSQLCGVSGRYM